MQTPIKQCILPQSRSQLIEKKRKLHLLEKKKVPALCKIENLKLRRTPFRVCDVKEAKNRTGHFNFVCIFIDFSVDNG